MRNIALFLSYLGTDYHGWQMQKNLPTVQETLEKAIEMIVSHDVHVTGCGRTDAGVHAKCYVANFRTELESMKLSFKEDAQKLSFNRVLESDGGEMALVYERWGIQ